MDSMSRKKSLPVYEDVEIPRTKNIDYSYYLQEIRGFTSEEIKKWSIQVVDDLSKKYNGYILRIINNNIYLIIYNHGIRNTSRS
jgi:hypothetical protein